MSPDTELLQQTISPVPIVWFALPINLKHSKKGEEVWECSKIFFSKNSDDNFRYASFVPRYNVRYKNSQSVAYILQKTYKMSLKFA